MVKKLSQNGIESLISKESLVLVPEGEQNGHAEKDEPEVVTNNSDDDADQQVINL